MSEVDDFLEHYGVKGMKWGVRRAQKKAAKADKKWEKNIYSTKGAVAVHNAAADRANNGGLDKLNNQPKYKKLNAFDESAPLTKQYFKDYEKLSAQWVSEAVKEVHGVSPSGNLKATLDTSNPQQWSVKVTKTNAEHAAGVIVPDFFFELTHDAKGHITSMLQVKDEIAQSDLDIEEFIEHYGIKGMKWGVRRSKAEIAKASADAKKAEKIRETAKTSGTNALTNKQLQTAINRMNLEVNYARLNEQTRKKSLGEKAVKFLMKDVAEVEVKRVVKGKAAITVEKTLSKHGQQDVADRIKPKKKK